jgi:alanyl-tRNA synthetase
MTIRLYYDDSYCRTFQARIVDSFYDDNRPAIILDRTCFYPTSGGQPFDTGTIDGVPVIDVFVREKDHEIVHVLAGEVTASSVEGSIEWPRRFDHMQQHSGQHILSQAFIQVTGWPTVSFHLGIDNCTIDLATTGVKKDQLVSAELLANRIIWENRSIQSRVVDQLSIEALDLRKAPDIDGDQYRLVDIADFDLCACGGTHVSRTGEIGLIKIIKVEQRGPNTRVEFQCGQRALNDYGYKNEILNNLSSELTTGYSEIEHSVNRIREEAKITRQQLKKQSKKLVEYEAQQLLNEMAETDKIRIVCLAYVDRSPDEIRLLANKIAQSDGNVALLGLAGSKSQIVFACSRNLPIEMNRILNQTLPYLGEATGGGSATFAQGGGPEITQKEMRKALD